MASVEAFARALTDRMIRYFDLPEERRDVLAFGIIYVFLYLLDAIGLLIACLISGVPGLTLMTAFTSMFFRSLTGGAHLSSPWWCSLFSFTLLALFGVLAAFLGEMIGRRAAVGFIAVVGVCAAVAIWLYAPVDSPAKPIPTPQKRQLRKAAWLLWTVWVVWEGFLVARGYLAAALASALGLMLQTASLTPGEARLLRWIDQRLTVSGNPMREVSQ
ncbi:MAG: accessory gene regulator B family protein [Betaproteobacteria bacterium]